MGTPAPGCNGTIYNILTPGSGPTVAKGATVTVHATGVVKETGKKFWSTKDPGQQAFTYKAGVGQVIKGWDQGLLGMQLGEQCLCLCPPADMCAQCCLPVTGEKRQVIIPGSEGYGAAGFPAWGIPPNGTLDFELEVLKIE